VSLHLIPKLKGHGRHRAVDKVAELDTENRRLFTQLMAANDAFTLLHQELADTRAKQGEAEELVVQQQADIDELADENARLRAELAPYKAAEANAHRIEVPPMIRQIDGPEDEATAPIDVRPLREAAAAGLLGPVTNPGRI
jgi:chromosome segregation ATPase